MKMILPSFVEVSLSESDKRSLILLLIIFAIFFILLGLIGVLVYKTMKWQGKKAESYMYNAVMGRVVKDEKHFRRLAFKKNWRLFYQQTFIPFCILLLATIVWLIFSIVNESWNENIYADFGDLFFVFDWSNATTKVFGLTLLADWPELVRGPAPVIEHLCAYIDVPIAVIGIVSYLVAGQATLSRFVNAYFTSKSVFSTTLKDKKVNEIDPNAVPRNPTNTEQPKK